MTRTHILPGDPPVSVALRRSPRARRFSLRVQRSDGQVSLSLPPGAPEAEALAFLRAREGWLRAQLARAAGPRAARIGAALPVEGVSRPVVAGGGRSARLFRDRIEVVDDDRQGPRLAALLKALARDRLADAAGAHAATLGRAHGKITLRDTRARWGSCSASGDLMFSWRLIMAPPEILDYVAAHEVAHLAHMDHSPRFWATCKRLCPATPAHRIWLREAGPELMAWRFAAC